MTETTLDISVPDIRALATEACVAAGGSRALASSLVDATLSAAQFGRAELGFPHFIDYLEGLHAGRINGLAEPDIQFPLPSIIQVDARYGIAQLGFDRSLPEIVERARAYGVVIFSSKGSYTVGELGYYGRRLVTAGVMSLAVANGPALMAPAPGLPPLFCTNPIAFAAPAHPGSPLLIDQASSATAFVNLRKAAAQGRAISAGWAVDAQGRPTTDPAAALAGALLPFGGYKGANIALLVEVMSAGLSGGAWSVDAGNFTSGNQRTAAALTIIAIWPNILDANFTNRCAAHLSSLEGNGMYVPGKRQNPLVTYENLTVQIEAHTLARIRAYASGHS